MLPWGVQVEDEVVGEAGGEDERRAVEGENDFGLEEAGDEVGVGGAERRGNGFGDCGETDDDDGLGIAKGGGSVEAEVEAGLLGEGDGGDVLVLSGVKAAEDAEEIDGCADVGAVVASGDHAGGAGLSDEVGVGAVGEHGEDVLGVAVVEESLVAGLGEAAVLHVDGELEAVVVRLEVEGAGEEGGVVEHGLGIGGRDLAHGGEILLDAGLLESGLGEILGGADEDSGAVTDGFFEGAEVASGRRGEEEDGLLGLFGDGYADAFFADLGVPGFDAGEPVVGGWVGGSAEEGGDEEVMDGLGGGKIGVQPDLVAGLEVGDVGDGEGAGVAGDTDFDAGAGEVEAGGLGEGEGSQEDGGEGKCGSDARTPTGE